MNEEQMRAQLDAMYASKSWRLTAPLRAIVAMLGRFKQRVTHPRRTIGNALRRAGRNPEIRAAGSRFLRRFPKLHARFKQVVNVAPAAVPITYAVPVAAVVIEPAAAIEVELAASQGEELVIAPVVMEVEKILLSAAARIVLAELRAARQLVR